MAKKRFSEGLYEKFLSFEVEKVLRNHSELGMDHPEINNKEECVELLLIHLIETLKPILLNKKVDQQIAFVNQLLQHIENNSSKSQVTNRVLRAVYRLSEEKLTHQKGPSRPSKSLIASHLIAQSKEESLIHHIRSEIPSADRIDLLCSFIKMSGLNLYKQDLKTFIDNGGRLRVLTTVYMGVTQRKAIDVLTNMGAEVKVSYNTRNTRLHAKSWLFYRNSGYSTAYIGSSNLSQTAQTEGKEWNVRISNTHAPQIIKVFEATFETYWQSLDFERYDGTEQHKKQFDEAIKKQNHDSSDLPYIDIKPYEFQSEILEKIHIERTVHHRYKNLIVAATGTGKTIMAALDYRRLYREHKQLRLLFLAHRKEILKQSLDTFRMVLRDTHFGERIDGANKPHDWHHVFASVQSLSKDRYLSQLNPQHFDMIIIDEFHHAAAETYQNILHHFRPKYLLGLTATPERTDGLDILNWFDGKMAAELRLWDAIHQDLLVPFQYFGISDGMDLSSISWNRGRYSESELSQLYTASDQRARLIFNALLDYIGDIKDLKAIGFCVGVDHANFMASYFKKHGVSAIAITGQTDPIVREKAKGELNNGTINIIFAVDIYNEGVDIPQINTVLFLRPTESATIFLQQLGRGLRKHPDKDCLTVLDFIGGAHREFRFDLRYKALLETPSRRTVKKQFESGFPFLPSGCAIQFDKFSKELVLENIKNSIQTNARSLTVELQSLGPDTTLKQFLSEIQMDVREFYTTNQWYWTRFRRLAGLEATTKSSFEETIGKRIGSLFQLDDRELIDFYRNLLKNPKDYTSLQPKQQRMLLMLLCVLFDQKAAGNPKFYFAQLLEEKAICSELIALFDLLYENIRHVSNSIPLRDEHIPLNIHCQYSRDQVLAAFNDIRNGKLYLPREGVYYNERTKCNLFFVTLHKKEEDYSSTTRYKDYAINETLFHWQSQSTTSSSGKKGLRHTQHEKEGITPLLFVRTHKKFGKRTMPYYFLGPAQYQGHAGERPMTITWRLENRMPPELYIEARAVS
ncbi:MAG: DUF3427 domain-containing protein [Flavobacteriaceae bacterium]|nr:DUF3427 domain-containing protein [Flavobacteriaceae bacterium]